MIGIRSLVGIFPLYSIIFLEFPVWVSHENPFIGGLQSYFKSKRELRPKNDNFLAGLVRIYFDRLLLPLIKSYSHRITYAQIIVRTTLDVDCYC